MDRACDGMWLEIHNAVDVEESLEVGLPDSTLRCCQCITAGKAGVDIPSILQQVLPKTQKLSLALAGAALECFAALHWSTKHPAFYLAVGVALMDKAQ